MGRDVPPISVSQQDRRRYREKVRRCLDAMDRMLRDGAFDTTATTGQVGLEVELHLVDEYGAPSMKGADVLAAIGDPHWAPELGRFNLEINVPPRPFAGDALDQLEAHLLASLKHADQRARDMGSHLAMIGTLPSLEQADVNNESMSANPRFWLLNEQICAARGEAARIAIDGPEELLTHVDNIMPEAACTSVQCHLQVSPEAFASYWNAAQVAAGVQVALGANSPFLFGKELWRETRITLFQQATDTRPEELQAQGVRPRVWFGDRWITSVFDLFEENIRYFPALLPLCDDQDPMAELDRGGIPELSELTLHNGTVYRWNRPVYAVTGGRPHLRVENRVLPAGPTVADVTANAAFYYGLVRSLAEARRPVWTQMPFSLAAENLTEAARRGIDACLYWPGLGVLPVVQLTLQWLLPLAREGLRRWGVDDRHAERCLAIIEQRCRAGRTGATWQVDTVRRLERGGRLDRLAALRRMTQSYIGHMHTNEPVHAWTLDG